MTTRYKLPPLLFPRSRFVLPRLHLGISLPSLNFGSMALPNSISDITRATAKLTEPFRQLTELSRECARLEAAGWLPHYTIPLELAHSGLEGKELSDELEAYFLDNWEVAHRLFLERLGGVDKEDSQIA